MKKVFNLIFTASLVLVISAGQIAVAAPSSSVSSISNTTANLGGGGYTSTGLYNLKDINPLTGNSYPSNPIYYKGKIFFNADDGTNGPEMWVSDGSDIGTTFFKNIHPGSVIGSNFNSPVIYKKKLYFTADNGTNGFELWKSDGTSGGTSMLKDILPGSGGSNPLGMFVYDNRLFFQASSSGINNELWVSDGTSTGTKMFKEINPSLTDGSHPANFVKYGGKLYFSANDGTHGYELWSTDGTKANTKMVKDIYPGISSSSATPLGVYKNKLFLSAFTLSTGEELWVSKGTTTSTKLFKDINPGAGSSNPSGLTVFKRRLYFAANDPAVAGNELWKSDGTFLGTNLFKDIYAGTSSSTPHGLSAFGTSKLIFDAQHPSYGTELWLSTGTPASTTLLVDLVPGTNHGIQASHGKVHRSMFVSANNTIIGVEPWMMYPTRIFADFFESGTLLNWSSIAGGPSGGEYGTRGGCTICIEGPSAIQGLYSIRVWVPDKLPHYLNDGSPSGNKVYNASFLLDTSPLVMSAGSKFKVFSAVQGAQHPFFLEIRKYSSKYWVRASVKLDGGSVMSTPWVKMVSAVNSIEVNWKAAKNATLHNGYIKLRLNRKVKAQLSGLDNDTWGVYAVKFGITGNIAPSHSVSGSFILDRFDSDSVFAIQP